MDGLDLKMSGASHLGAVTWNLKQSFFSLHDTLGCRHVKMKQKTCLVTPFIA